MQSPRGFNTIRVILVVLVLFALAAGAFLLLNEERARTRDAKRMADMARLSAAFFESFATEGTYAGTASAGGCVVNMPVTTCNLTTYLPDIATFKDPTKGNYVVKSAPNESSYAIGFTLERAYNSFPKGPHQLTQAGIQ